MSKTINQALADLVLGLGESSSILSDNMTVSDYIADVEKAIKDYAGGTAEALIDDTSASATKTYSSSKIASLIPEAELPTPSAGNNGKVATVVSDGEGGYTWGAEMPSKFHVVTGEYNEGTGKFIIDAGSQEKNVTDIINHITNGEPVFCIVRTGNSKYIFDVLVAMNNKIAFSGSYVASGTAYFYYTGAIEGDFPTLDIPSQVNMTVKELALT